jgi:hypothetical protein
MCSAWPGLERKGIPMLSDDYEQPAGRPEITPKLVEQIEQWLIDTTDSEQEIADRFNVPLSVVEIIAFAERPDERPKAPPAKKYDKPLKGSRHLDNVLLDRGEKLLAEPVVCPKCERRIIVVPCRICRAIKFRKERKCLTGTRSK